MHPVKNGGITRGCTVLFPYLQGFLGTSRRHTLGLPIATSRWQTIHQRSCPSVIANLTGSQKKPDRQPNCVSYGMQLGPCRRLFQSPAGQRFRPPLVRLSDVHAPLFYPQAGGRAMCIAVSRVDRDCLVVGCFGSQSHHNPRENPHVTPSFPAVVERLVWAIFLGASHQRKPLRLMKIIPLRTRLPSTRGTPWLFEKQGRSRAI